MSKANLILPNSRPAVTSVKSAMTCNSGTGNCVVKKNSMGVNLLKKLSPCCTIGRMADKLKCKQSATGPYKKPGTHSRPRRVTGFVASAVLGSGSYGGGEVLMRLKSQMILTCMITLLALTGCSMRVSPYQLSWQSPYKDLSSLKEGDIVHLPTGVKVSKAQLINMLSGNTIVYVGEAHDNLNAHKVQLEILRDLAVRHPDKIAVGMEMLRRPSQEVADQWTSGELGEKEFVRTWVKDWTNDFQYYRPILEYVRDHHIPLLALRAPDEWLERVKKNDSADDLQEGDGKLPDMDIEDPYHRAHTKAIFGKHPGKNQSFEEFYKVQVLWDESMAQSISQYLLSQAGRDKQLVIFVGSQHVEYGFGIPRRVFRRVPSSYAIVLPTTTHVAPEKQDKLMKVTLPQIPLLPGDFAWMVAYQDLEDQRVYLGVMIRKTPDGVKILRTIDGSAAAKAGLKESDIVTAFDGEAIETTFDLTYLISSKKPGDKGVIEVLRDKQPLRLEVTFQASHHHP